MDWGRKDFGTLRKMKKSQSQPYLRKKGKSKRQKLPTLAERKAGGIYGVLNANKRHKPDPLKAQLDMMSSGLIQPHGCGLDYKPPQTNKPGQNLDPIDFQQLQTIRRDFVKNTKPMRLNPITHREHQIVKKREKTEKNIDEIMKMLDRNKGKDDLDLSSEDSLPKHEAPSPVKSPKQPQYKNLLYHDSDSQVGTQDRYVSEMRAMGNDTRPLKKEYQTAQASPKRPIINKALREKSTVMSVFPSHGIQGAKNPFSTTNQMFDFQRSGEPIDHVDRAYFRPVYNMKTYMEEMLKAKNMRGEKK